VLQKNSPTKKGQFYLVTPRRLQTADPPALAGERSRFGAAQRNKNVFTYFCKQAKKPACWRYPFELLLEGRTF
jgi:hypothetical protein